MKAPASCYTTALKTLRKLHIYFWRSIIGMNQAATIDNLNILYKSDNYIVVNKHYDIKINSNDDEDRVTVAKQLGKMYPDLVDTSIEHQFRFVHRLDYSTSGAVAVALNRKAAGDAMSKFKKHLVTKEYVALVRGHVKVDHMTITKAICPETKEGFTHMMRIADDDDVKKGGCKVQTAKTELLVLQRGLYGGDPVTKIKLVPFTGKRHQLRVHCNSVGHTILGDYTYSNRTDFKPYRMMLHSHKLVIPLDNENIDIDASDPFVKEVDKKWLPQVQPLL
ncbi:RNA pseudouridylate synthase domain-containing protein 1-like [Antedon mediterranea]|uniref:RNA pseudouridylate synthase domain-containing protein 1-like n=1 Tax=Antedon mediterranea TaxID=105859 RepID=UPI003AF96E57